MKKKRNRRRKNNTERRAEKSCCARIIQREDNRKIPTNKQIRCALCIVYRVVTMYSFTLLSPPSLSLFSVSLLRLSLPRLPFPTILFSIKESWPEQADTRHKNWFPRRRNEPFKWRAQAKGGGGGRNESHVTKGRLVCTVVCTVYTVYIVCIFTVNIVK